jgi:conjugative relaxase-like TrwC/TraI family protein
VQSTHKIPGASATPWSRYLVSQATRGDYYTHDGQDGQAAPTQWHGPEALLRSYGIDPNRPVELKHLRSLMHGYSPVDGEPIRPVGSNGTRVAGIDLTFSPPKSVSALWATAGPYRRALIEVAHRRAVKSALERTEREVALVRRKTDGVVRFERADRLLAVESLHTTSRLARDHDEQGIPDPQLHSHVAVIAAVRTDGQVAAVESKQLFRAARENGAWYRAELAENLKQLGLPIERRTGNRERYLEIGGVSKELSEYWSTRSQDVDRAARVFRQRYGREPRANELDSLTLGTRGSKSAASSVEVSGAWRALGAEHNQTERRSEELFNDWGLRNDPKVDLATELLGAVTRETSTITRRELRAKAYELSAGVCRPDEADRVIDELTRSGELIELQDGTWTTRSLRKLEQATVEIAERRASENTVRVSESSLKQARREIGREIKGSLAQEQRDALEALTGLGGIAVLVGRAGTGKGVTLAAAARAWQLEDREVIGTAVAGAIAQRLQADAKLDRSFTIDGLLGGVEKGRIELGPGSVVVMDEAGVGDTERVARLVKMTARYESKLVLAGDAAQLSSIGPGGLFKELQGNVPTAELTEVHRAHHEWERKAWEQIRNGQPGPALAQYNAHDRLHIHDTRAQAAEAMVENWDQDRRQFPGAQAVMITDASNKERDQINALAQERRARAGELGSHRVDLPDKPYGLASGDEIMFTGQYRIPGAKRVENGITGTILHTSREEDRVTVKTRERESREVDVNTGEFSDISLAYAVHVHKGQGLTAETSGILTGGWQTDREHAYVAVSRAREQTQIYTSREDLGEQGMDTGAIKRLAQRIERSRAQEATIAKQTAAERDDDQVQPERDSHRLHPRRRARDRVADEDGIVRDPRAAPNERDEQTDTRPVPQTNQGSGPSLPDIREADPKDVRLNVVDHGDTQLVYSNAYDLTGHTGEPTYVLFGGWQTERTLGYVAVAQNDEGRTEVQIRTEDRGDREIETELKDRIGQAIERIQAQQANPGHHASPGERANTPQPDREHAHQADQPAELQPAEACNGTTIRNSLSPYVATERAKRVGPRSDRPRLALRSSEAGMYTASSQMTELDDEDLHALPTRACSLRRRLRARDRGRRWRLVVVQRDRALALDMTPPFARTCSSSSLEHRGELRQRMARGRARAATPIVRGSCR